MGDVDADVIDEFRANGGSVGGALAGVPLLLLTHRGARTGTHRTTPLGYVEGGGRLILFASNRGAARTLIGTATSWQTPTSRSNSARRDSKPKRAS